MWLKLGIRLDQKKRLEVGRGPARNVRPYLRTVGSFQEGRAKIQFTFLKEHRACWGRMVGRAGVEVGGQ